jgi:release factor glutamine methyltransferase
MQTYIQTIKKTANQLENAGIEGAYTESELILSELTDCSRMELLLKSNESVPEKILASLEEIVERRKRREPLQYILGYAYFMNLKLHVTPSVLIPRPETELLVEYVLKKLPENCTVLDIGTGSGAIALALAYERKGLQVTGIDISKDALKIAEQNLKKYRLKNVVLMQSNLFENLGSRKFDCITANLPYVTEDEYSTLMPEVKDFEPKLALTATQEGLEIIYECIKKAPEYLNSQGLIIFEMGISQAAKIHNALENTGKFKAIKTIQDYSKRDRFVCAELI